ncbi:MULTISPECIES: glycosyltransferase family 4 protein [Bradyrhizobium]|uniref:glycosyltransferase family 4 protein n=1 Tax=Bradyrhizobium TaxID=374 RepID=UPI000400FC68|nr:MULTISPECIES: glycosyltransferase family 4 protein [Bradyrhizobium]UFW47072.1 glycosyltransferase family 4 protein [Bradyrhizobium arachidis]
MREASAVPARKRLLFVVTEDWYFVSHRLPIARAALAAGYEVLVATRLGEKADAITREGFTPIGLERMRRSGRNPLHELASIAELVKLYRSHRPSLVHHVAMKPVLYGSIAARLAGVAAIVNNVAGLGFVFASKAVYAQTLRRVIAPLLRFALSQRQALTIVQNRDDARVLADEIGVAPVKIRLVKGSGVDLAQFSQVRRESSPPIVLLASRMIKEKGVEDFVRAAARLRDKNVAARFVLAGAPDPENPHSIPEAVLRQYHEDGLVEWWGHRDNIPEIIREAAIVCLPTTYGEGIPKTLIEAAAGECPIVTYDVPGCREIVTDGTNGMLVPAGDVGRLADAIAQLLANPEQRKLMGAQGRKLVQAEFSQEIVVAQTLAIYSELLAQ